MYLDILAGLLLMALYLFGGAAIFDGPSTKYREVLMGWSAFNGLIVLCGLLAWAASWAFGRLYA